MDKDTLIILGAAAAALYLIASKTVRPAASRPTGTAASLNNYGNTPVTQIENTALPGQNGYAWAYYSNGVAIDPQGNYYLNGQMVWSPTSGAMGYGA